MTEPVSDRHITDEELSAYLEDALSGAERERVERHLDTCETCLVDAAGAFRAVRGGSKPKLFRQWGLMLGAAAVIALIFVGTLEPPGSTGPVFRAAPDSSGYDALATILVIRPENGRIVPRESLTFIWRAQESGAFYRFALTDDAGSVVWRASTRDTTLIPDPGLRLEPGRDYFWIVDGLLDGGRTGSTGAQVFRITRSP
jgi:hypothetical protein